MVPSAVLIFGPPGSGKSTQAGLLADTLALEVVDAGVVIARALKDPARQQDPVIIEQKKHYEAGELVDIAFFTAEVVSKLKSLEARKVHCVITGWPRDITQAEAVLPPLFEIYGKENTRVLLLDVSKETCIVRSKARLTCTVCGRPQLATGPAAAAPVHCRACGGDLAQRSDIAAIEKRFDVYEQQTKPVLAYIESLGLPIIHVDSEADPAVVYERIVEAATR